ncbi:unnamed protein product [Macrosiphum euphorbiae]|uniref:Uncharacterized protein n=1 Tax=Macrosiphum euphorbiae TaxID=13131 RepID=A0AAV0Y1G0_9HEMI|nr:unnamed protein product [Macrosiphum euphorbiae]
MRDGSRVAVQQLVPDDVQLPKPTEPCTIFGEFSNYLPYVWVVLLPLSDSLQCDVSVIPLRLDPSTLGDTHTE